MPSPVSKYFGIIFSSKLTVNDRNDPGLLTREDVCADVARGHITKPSVQSRFGNSLPAGPTIDGRIVFIMILKVEVRFFKPTIHSKEISRGLGYHEA